MVNNNNISDELLAAYLDGNTTEEETQRVLAALREDAALREAVEIAMRADSVPLEVLPMMQMAAQSGENLCGLLCEAYILNRRGIDCNKDELMTVARENHWLRPEGLPLHAMGQLLGHMGLMVTHTFDADINDIAAALDHDNDVIVAVDNDKLYADTIDEEDIANHAVVVTDITDDKIIIYDPERGGLQTVGITEFIQAWQTSLNYMVRVLQDAEEYDPQPINVDDIELTGDLLELREAIAENAHDVWATDRLKEGWVFGPERDDILRRHPDLIPYSALSDSEKQYDRKMAMSTIKLLKRLGFDIVKR